MKLIKRRTIRTLQGALIILSTVAVVCVSTTAYSRDWDKEKYWEEFAREELKNAPAAIKKATALEKAQYISFKFCKKCDELGIKHNDSVKDRARSGLTHFDLVPGTCGWISDSLGKAFSATNLGTRLQIITHVPSRTYLQGVKAKYYDGVNYNHAATALEIEGKIFVFDPWFNSYGKDADNLGDIHPKSKWISMPASEWGERMNDVGYDMFILENEQKKQWRGEGPQGLADAIELYHDDQWDARMRLKRARKRIREREIERSRGQAEKPPTGQMKPRVIRPDNNRTDKRTQESLSDRTPEPETRPEKPPRETTSDTGSGLSPGPADLHNWEPNKIKEYYGADDVYRGPSGTIHILKDGQWQQVLVQETPARMFPAEGGRKDMDACANPIDSREREIDGGVSAIGSYTHGFAEIPQQSGPPRGYVQDQGGDRSEFTEIVSGADDTDYCPEDPDELKAKCAKVNAYIKAFESQGPKAKWTASIQRAYLFRAQCCGYRWTTEGPEGDPGKTKTTDAADGGFPKAGQKDVGLMGVSVNEKDQDVPAPPSDADDGSWFDEYQDELREHRARKYQEGGIEGVLQQQRKRREEVANDPEWQMLMQKSQRNFGTATQGLSNSTGYRSSEPSSQTPSPGWQQQQRLPYMEKDVYRGKYRKYQKDSEGRKKTPSSKGARSEWPLMEVDPGDTTVSGEENINDYWPSQTQ